MYLFSAKTKDIYARPWMCWPDGYLLRFRKMMRIWWSKIQEGFAWTAALEVCKKKCKKKKKNLEWIQSLRNWWTVIPLLVHWYQESLRRAAALIHYMGAVYSLIVFTLLTTPISRWLPSGKGSRSIRYHFKRILFNEPGNWDRSICLWVLFLIVDSDTKNLLTGCCQCEVEPSVMMESNLSSFPYNLCGEILLCVICVEEEIIAVMFNFTFRELCVT